MLEDLKILNGELSPKYDKYNNLYTVHIDSNVNKLDFVFKEDDNLNIYVYGNNNLKVGENKIIISLTDNEQTNYIYITAIKDEVKEVIDMDTYNNKIEVANSMPIYGGPLIILSCFLLIITMFFILFRRRKTS